ncbi:hypothetical protein COY91_02320 [Candidatus Shapirobacteria bacterium CG_4_10_14_0_8_um_filter_39_15]|nr:MAG: hypothetical protein COY91_02320 [Candidatus Shapirobacteria bacterium CG_4_10_14_0_8_um_filter_39_15]
MDSSKISDLGYRILDFQLWEGNQKYLESATNTPGTYQTTITTDKFYVKIYYSAYNESKTFILKYKILNAITAQQDIGEFYWQLIGDQWAKSTGQVTAAVLLPEPAPNDQIWAYGHGPLNGQIKIATNQQINFTAANLPAYKFFEVRVLFPKAQLSSVTAISDKTLAQIMAEEKGFGEQTDKAKKPGPINWFLVILLSLPLVGLILFGLKQIIYWSMQWYKVGRDNPLPEVNLAGTLHEPPSDLDPSLVEALMNGNLKPTGKSIVATVLSLCRKKAVKIETQSREALLGIFNRGPESFLTLINKEGLSVRETKLVNFLFRGNDRTIGFSEIKDYGREHPYKTRSFWEDWQNTAAEELIDDGIMDKTAHIREI